MAKKIGLISQENYLLDDTLLNNIVFIDDDIKIDKFQFTYSKDDKGIKVCFTRIEVFPWRVSYCEELVGD